MENILGNIMIAISFLIGIIIVFGILYRILKNFISKKKTTDAVGIDKQSYKKQIYSKQQAPYTNTEYIITFLCGNKKKNFMVSELSYISYTVNQKGKLTYKGDKIINFKK